MIELVLPSGRFAALRSLTLGDYLAAIDASGSRADRLYAELLSRALTIDGAALSAAEVLALEFEEIAPVIPLMSRSINALSARGVA